MKAYQKDKEARINLRCNHDVENKIKYLMEKHEESKSEIIRMAIEALYRELNK